MIKKVVLKDIFAFSGENNIDFDRLNILLADNGYGKTSLLNALKLAFGKKFKNQFILNTNSKDKKAFIKVYLDEFVLERKWDFNNNIDEVYIYDNNKVLEDFEAEQFLDEKYPKFLLDFIFFDGEIEKDSLLTNSNKIKKIFNYFFDLDIILNLSIDTKKVANSLAHKLGDDDIKEFKSLKEKELSLKNNIDKLKTEISNINREIKLYEKELKKIKTKIRRKNKDIEHIEVLIQEIDTELEILVNVFKNISLYQMPLIMNEDLLNSLENLQAESSIKILNEKVFEHKLEDFLSYLNVDMNKNIMNKFNEIFNIQEDIRLDYTKEEFKNLLKDISDKIFKKQKLENQYDLIKKKIKTNDNLKRLFLDKDNISKKIEQYYNLMNDLNSELDSINREYIEVLNLIKNEFLNKRERFAKINSIESLYKISSTAKNIYEQKLEKFLEQFNKKFSEYLKMFLEKYNNIEVIYLDKSFKFIIKDKNGNYLDVELLSSGQKQILTFIFINSLLEYKMIDFIFIDTPFGRLSNENKEFILKYYLKFPCIVLLLTSSEYEFIKTKSLDYIQYKIIKNEKGSRIIKW